MEGFTYTNIFETKGIEYLAIIAFFAILLPFWFLLNRQVKISREIQRSLGFLTAGSLKIPQGLFFSRFHTWSHLEKSGVAKVGLDDFLVKLTGECHFINLKHPGERISKGDLLATIVQNGKHLSVFSPVTGQIMEANNLLESNPLAVLDDPYTKGWLYKIKPESWVADISGCYLAGAATNWTANEFDRFRDFMTASAGSMAGDFSHLVMQDGGELSEKPLAGLPQALWTEFQQDFLSNLEVTPEFELFSES